MVIKKKSAVKKWFVVFIAGCLVSPVYSKIDNWLWKIDKTEFNIGEFSNDYKTYVELMAWQMGTSAGALQEYLNKADDIADPRTRAVIEQMKPQPFAENYLILSLLKKHAIENKYFEQPGNSRKKEFISDYIIVQLYLNEIIAKLPVAVKDEDVEKQWISERDKNENFKSLPIEQGLIIMKQKMIQDKREGLRKEFIKALSERYKVEKNPDYTKILSNLKINF